MIYHPETPWHFWPMTVLTLVWQAFLATVYVLWRIEHDMWTALFPPEQTTFLNSLPLWADLLWALSVWTGLLGALLMAGRVAGASLALALGFLAAMVLLIALLLVPPGLVTVAGGGNVALLVGAVAVSAGLWAYAREQKQMGVLD